MPSIPTYRAWRGSLAALGLLAVGCHRTPAPPPPAAVNPDEARQVLSEGFAQSAAADKELSGRASEALQEGHYSDAYLLLNQLSAKSELSAAEREAANRARVGLMVKLQEAAANGDRQAADLIEQHRASK